jgi:hypothetical protein
LPVESNATAVAPIAAAAAVASSGTAGGGEDVTAAAAARTERTKSHAITEAKRSETTSNSEENSIA